MRASEGQPSFPYILSPLPPSLHPQDAVAEELSAYTSLLAPLAPLPSFLEELLEAAAAASSGGEAESGDASDALALADALLPEPTTSAAAVAAAVAAASEEADDEAAADGCGRASRTLLKAVRNVAGGVRRLTGGALLLDRLLHRERE